MDEEAGVSPADSDTPSAEMRWRILQAGSLIQLCHLETADYQCFHNVALRGSLERLRWALLRHGEGSLLLDISSVAFSLVTSCTRTVVSLML